MENSQDLLPLEGSKSAVWKCFGFPSLDGQITTARKDRKQSGSFAAKRSYSSGTRVASFGGKVNRSLCGQVQ